MKLKKLLIAYNTYLTNLVENGSNHVGWSKTLQLHVTCAQHKK